MDKRGVYRKGSAGHVRNGSSYKIAHEKIQKWRFPLTIVAGLVLLFGVSPMVGDQLTASILTHPDIAAQVENQPQEARKIILTTLHQMAKDCERFLMEECFDRSESLIAQASDSNADLKNVLASAVAHESYFAAELAHNACKYDLGQMNLDLAKAQTQFNAFADSYGEAIDVGTVASTRGSLDIAVTAIKELSETCR